MHFWISCNDDAEVVSEIFFDESDELIGICETIVNGDPVINTGGRITSESKNVLDTIIFGLVQNFDNFFSGEPGTSEMHKGVQANELLDMATHIEGSVTGAATSTPCKVDP